MTLGRPVLRFAAATAAALSVACTASSAQAQDKFALAMFHFNIQYVVGGMYGYWAAPNPGIDLDERQIEDQIITESFEPIVALFERHPTWATNLEMQAYMLDVMAERHPAVLDRVRTLAEANRLDIVSFHYGDQFYIAYPQEDWERSQALTKATFAKHGMPLSRSVFCQEGQAGVGLASAMARTGYRTLVWPKNLWLEQHGEFTTQPLYKFGDALLIGGSRDVAYTQGNTSIEVRWTFLDDGELLATGDMNPYFPDLFKHQPEVVAKYEQQLTDLETQGFRIATVEQYVDAVKDKVQPAGVPPLLDGTWQPGSTSGVLRWMGGKGLWGKDERDNHVRTLGAMAHREMMAAETIAQQAGIDANVALDGAWRLLFLGQVSDATGINPFRGEVEYGIGHFTEVLRVARQVIRDAKTAMALDAVTIDPAAGVTSGWTEDAPVKPIAAPLQLTISAGNHAVDQVWEEVAPGHARVTLHFAAGTTPTVRVTFPAPLADEFSTTLALEDGQVRSFKRSDFGFDDFRFAMPVGLIGPVPGQFIVKDQGHVHLAATLFREKGDVEFVDETVPPDESFTWVFHTVDGTAEDALSIARSLNAKRRVLR